jgi:hypothetical protein
MLLSVNQFAQKKVIVKRQDKGVMRSGVRGHKAMLSEGATRLNLRIKILKTVGAGRVVMSKAAFSPFDFDCYVGAISSESDHTCLSDP